MASEEENDKYNKKAKVTTKRNSNPGVRLVHGKIYDSVNGKTCHWCRQKTLQDHVKCSFCNVKFCGPCLKNRNGEFIELETQPGNAWVCPKCRKGCGPGCNHCCNCGPCRKEQGLGSTGVIVHVARNAGFTNVHDFLIFKTTRETPHEISARKIGRGWCKSAEHFWSRTNDIEIPSQRVPMRYADHQQKSMTRERMRGSLTEDQVKQLSKCYLSQTLSTEKKFLGHPHDCRASFREDNICSSITESYVNDSKGNPPLSGSIPSIVSNAASVAVVSTSVCTQTSGKNSSKLAFQHQDPSVCPLEASNLSNKEGNDWLSDTKPVENINSSQLVPENMKKADVQPLHNAFSRDVSDCIWANSKFFDLPPAFKAETESFNTEIVEIDSDGEDKDYKIFMENVRSNGVSYFLDLKIKEEGLKTRIIYEDYSSDNEKKSFSFNGKEKCKLSHMASESEQKKKRLSSAGEINHASANLQTLELFAEKRQAYFQDCTRIKTEVPSPEPSSPCDLAAVKNIECSEIPLSIQSDDFEENLKAALQKPYSTQELNELWTVMNNRKPIERLRHTRQRTIRVETKEEGFSYLDYYPDLDERLSLATYPEEKLTLLRGFFFWLQHASWPRAFQPWISSRKNCEDDDDSDCMEVDVPHSEVQSKQVMAVVLPEDDV